MMIIKGLFKRYERWNPVHPTSGAFWGMGIGVGCGIGWGPGFGPEVIGYVGAGCGVGFNVGLTVVGVGIGLPANYITEAPCKAVAATSRNALDFARSNCFPMVNKITGDGLSSMSQKMYRLHKVVHERIPTLRSDVYASTLEMNKRLVSCSGTVSKWYEQIRIRYDTLPSRSKKDN